MTSGLMTTPEAVYKSQTQCATNSENIPQDLRVLQQWIGWKYEEQPGGKKPKKAPINPHTGRKADNTDPEVWGTFEEAQKAVERYKLDGIGIALTEADPYVGIDLDEAIDNDTGELKPWAAQIIERFGSYSEISPSGRGVRIIARGELPDKGVHKTN